MRYPFVLCLPIRNQHQLPASDSIQPNPSTECYSHKGSEKLTINRRVFEGSQRYLNTRLKCKERERNLISTKEQKLHIKEYNVAYNLIGPKAIPYASLKGIQFETNINKILSRVTACFFHFSFHSNTKASRPRTAGSGLSHCNGTQTNNGIEERAEK